MGSRGEGGADLARKVVAMSEKTPATLRYAYELDDSIEEKITKVVQTIYHGSHVIYDKKVRKQIRQLTTLGFANLPICIAKTQYSFSDKPQLIGAPEDFDITVKELRLSAGAGFIVVITGEIMTMPGLPKVPAAETIDIDNDGNITGLF